MTTVKYNSVTPSLVTPVIGQPTKTAGPYFNTTGRIVYLRAQEFLEGYGAPERAWEVVIKLDTHKDWAFGFPLVGQNVLFQKQKEIVSYDLFLPSFRAMYDLILKAYEHNWQVMITHDPVDQNMARIRRVIVTRP